MMMPLFWIPLENPHTLPEKNPSDPHGRDVNICFETES